MAANQRSSRWSRPLGVPRTVDRSRQGARLSLTIGPGLARATEDHDTAARALARAYGVQYEVFTAEEVDDAAQFHPIGYELELTGRARPLMHVWHGPRLAAEHVHAALQRIARFLLGGPCEPVLCNPDSTPPRREDREPGPVSMRIGLYHHDHPLQGGPTAQPCLRSLHERLASLSVPART